MHKKIGIIGGLTPESTVSYYLYITRSYVEKFGNYGYPEIIIYSVNLENYHQWRNQNKWNFIIDDLVHAANKLEIAGADFALIATNTMHKVFDQVQSAVNIPLYHIINPTIVKIKEKKITKVGLLGTKFTMSEDFYKNKLADKNITTFVPDINDQQIIHRIIEDELGRGILLDESRKIFLTIIEKLKEAGAEGIILGCTEIPLIVKQEDCSIPVFDTASLHADFALTKALE
jgi:aspartate racemase